MPEYLAPGVFVEEVSYRAKSIEGVSTTTTGFVGATRYGPTDLEPEIITSLVEFERIYGGQAKLSYAGTEQDNYMWNAVRGFFEEGGKRLYVARAFTAGTSNGRANRALVHGLRIQARFPGAAGNGRVSFQFQLGQNRLVMNGTDAEMNGISHGDVVHLGFTGDAADEPDDLVGFYLVQWDGTSEEFSFTRPNPTQDPADDTDDEFSFMLADFDAAVTIRRATASIFYESASSDLPTFAMVDLALDTRHTANGRPDSILDVFARNPANVSDARSLPIQIFKDQDADGNEDETPYTGLDFISNFVVASAGVTTIGAAALTADDPDPALTTVTFALDGGDDGVMPNAIAYEGAVDPTTNRATGLKAMENIEDISIIAAPGSSITEELGQPVANLLMSHARRMKYRIAVIDSVKNASISSVRAYRAKFDSKYAAFYYPWVRIIDPVTGQENHYPPSGFVSGIYARNDSERAVYKAPANEVVNLAIGFEKFLNTGQQEVLNPEGVNCFRFFEGRGMRVWGARTMTSDPEWKYVNLRRYFAYLERSIDKGTQWAVFEPNGERLWANVRRTIEDFLLNEFQNGALLGDKPENSYFVKCDRSTMTQNDLDNGRLVCQVGVAPLRPAEFVIFRVGQWTADRKS